MHWRSFFRFMTRLRSGVWRYLDTCQFKIYLHARIPRVKCPVHRVRQVKVSWAGAHLRFKVHFKRLAIEVLKEADLIFCLFRTSQGKIG